MTEQVIQFCQQFFWRDIQEFDAAFYALPTYKNVDRRVISTIESFGLDTVSTKRFHLILHQTDQGRYHNGSPWHREGRNLIANAFPATCRHQHQSVLSAHDVSDDFFLIWTERIIAEILF